MILKFSFISRLLNLKENLKEKNVVCTKSAQEILKDENLSEELAFIETNFCECRRVFCIIITKLETNMLLLNESMKLVEDLTRKIDHVPTACGVKC